MAADSPRNPDSGAPDARAVRRHFARAAATYDDAAVLQKEIGARLAERLDAVKLAPAAVLDAGCGTGDAQAELAARYPHARYVGLDVALPMLAAARSKAGLRRSALTRIFATFARGRAARRARFRLRRHRGDAVRGRNVRPRVEQPRAAMGRRPSRRRSRK